MVPTGVLLSSNPDLWYRTHETKVQSSPKVSSQLGRCPVLFEDLWNLRRICMFLFIFGFKKSEVLGTIFVFLFLFSKFYRPFSAMP